MTVTNRFEVLGGLEDLVELWDTFTHETHGAAKGCNGERPRSQGGLASVGTMEAIEKSHATRLAGSRCQYKALYRRT